MTEALPGSQVGRLPVCYRVEAEGAGLESCKGRVWILLEAEQSPCTDSLT